MLNFTQWAILGVVQASTIMSIKNATSAVVRLVTDLFHRLEHMLLPVDNLDPLVA
jgi:hypothetical protein